MNIRLTVTALAIAATAAAITVPSVAAADAGTIAGTPTAATTTATVVPLAGYSVAHVTATGNSTGPSGSSGAGPGASGAAHPSAHPAARHPRLRWLRNHRLRLAALAHAQWTTKAKDGSYVTHDAIHGTVTATTSGDASITVTAGDHTAQTYATSSTTKVWQVVKANGKRHIKKATLAAVTKGAEVIVEGTGATGPFAATRILVQLPK